MLEAIYIWVSQMELMGQQVLWDTSTETGAEYHTL